MVSILIPSTGIVPDLDLLDKELKGLEYEVIIQFDHNKEGKGITLQRAFERAKGDRIVWIDSDFQIHPHHIKKYLNVNVDIVVACKLHPCSKIQYPLLRLLITNIHALIVRILFNLPLRETQTGLKIFKREIIARNWQVKGFGHDIEVLTWAYHHGKTIVEMPVKIDKAESSTVNLKGCLRTFYEMLWLWWGMISGGKIT